jgi:DNA-binding MarR family transcriptional regulator
MSLLQSEIGQDKPFETVNEELWLNLSRTAAIVSLQVEHRLRPHGLSPTQYNVLRILRGAGSGGLVQHEVGARLVAQVPDVPRILSRMEKAGWVLRVRGTADRRVVQATLTESGIRLVDALDETMRQVHLDLFPSMTDEEMRALCDLLALARGQRPGVTPLR